MKKASRAKVNGLYIPYDGPASSCADCGVKFVWQTFHFGTVFLCPKCYKHATTDELLNRDNMVLKADTPTPMIVSSRTKQKDRSDMDEYLGEGCTITGDRRVY